MHISEIKSKQGDKIYRGVLLRQSYRDENGKSQKRTIANLSALEPGAIEVLKAYYHKKKLIGVHTKRKYSHRYQEEQTALK